ncbi:hypothetical protein [Commensalibacter papalotli (ex Botero et al. 2024)]|uniref:hypothetical protein n=1 Tax=Commensalibacter papalotli (ex Botero et al. 2024) TaxID=2972766 RepID=UPI0022FF66A8|nr:hypothetical protein [Commensalibacter papalotli (ex Botero et al. 2024)]CAI3958332.1 unnamed protein product [Commensalibacter papalotli (ex Botero et al. 2024)]
MINNLIKLCEYYCEMENVSVSFLSNSIFQRGNTIYNLQNGKTITVRNYERAVEWLSDHWPEDKEWPDFIERPKVKERIEG